MPRLGGVRDCFRARPGYVYCSVDYSAGELCTLAQVCLWLFGKSHMADTINASGDPGALHTAFAATLSGRTAEEMTMLVKAKDEDAKKKRTVAKFLNFGLPGGMGAAKFILTARKKNAGTTRLPDGSEVPGIRFCVLLLGAERCGVERVTEWKGRPRRRSARPASSSSRPSCGRRGSGSGPRSASTSAWVTGRVDGGGELPCFATERVRGGLDFTNGANNGFQALLADAAKHALRAVVRECYLDEGSPLFGSRPIFFAHDEIMAEMPETTAHLAGPRMSQVMVAKGREYVEDVAMVADPALMFTWSKAVESVYRSADGRFYDRPDVGRTLVPWELKAASVAVAA
jgi:DNA polymerase-1